MAVLHLPVLQSCPVLQAFKEQIPRIHKPPLEQLESVLQIREQKLLEQRVGVIHSESDLHPRTQNPLVQAVPAMGQSLFERHPSWQIPSLQTRPEIQSLSAPHPMLQNPLRHRVLAGQSVLASHPGKQTPLVHF